jgi:hypothetical protein
MDAFTIVRVVLLGMIWAATVYTIVAYVFLIFPLPTYFYVSTRLRSYAKEQQKKSLKQGELWFERRYSAMRFLGWLLWLGIIGLYIYTFAPILAIYLPKTDAFFFQYYGVGVALPSLWLLWRAARAMRVVDAKTKALEDNSATLKVKSLIQQIEGK